MEGLEAYADIVRRPHLPAAGFEAARDLALQGLAGIDDEPRQKLMIKLREWHFPSPYGRNTMGRVEDLEKLTLDLSRADFKQRYHAARTRLSPSPAISTSTQCEVRDRSAASATGTARPRRRCELLPPPGQCSSRGAAERADAHRHRLPTVAGNRRRTITSFAWPSKCSAAE